MTSTSIAETGPRAANTLAPLFEHAGAVLPADTAAAAATKAAPAAEAFGPAMAIAPTTAFGIGLPLFALAIAVSPGPSNLVLLSVGARIGLRGGLSLLTGMALGYALLWAGASSGLRLAADIDPTLMRFAQGCAFALTLLMAWKLTRAGAMASSGRAGRTSIVSGIAFQLLNPKAWVTALAAAALFAAPEVGTSLNAAWFASCSLVAVLIGCGVWLVAGQIGRGILTRPAVQRGMNGVLAITLLGSAVPMLFA